MTHGCRPRSLHQGTLTFTVFHPQLDTWDGYRIAAHAAVSVLPDGSKDPTFGVVEIAAVTVVDKLVRSVAFQDVQIVKSTFPGAPDWVPIDGTNLLHVTNTTGNVFEDITSQTTCVLVTGRWFSVTDLNGPRTAAPRRT